MKSVDISLNSVINYKNGLSICLGYFDGVHLGHKKLIKQCEEKGRYEKAILTFSEPISHFLNVNKSKDVITSLTDRFRIVSRFNLDYYFIFHINKDFLNISPIEFIDILKKMNAKEIYCGNDYRFGKDAKGDIDLLKQYFDVNVVDMYLVDNKKISTQKIIDEIKNGYIESANAKLGQNYQICGTVVKGLHNGTKFGIKTANIKFDTNYVVPKNGVYKVIIYIDNMPYKAIANVGIHPTISSLENPILEVHILNYSNDVYGKNVYVEFLKFIREERKFSSTDELVNQIKKDMESIK